MAIGDFTDQAEAYHKSRPSYPAELLDGLASEIGVRAGDPVLDIGAGTGILTALLADRGYRVTAVEPNEAMRSFADAREGVTWRDGTFAEMGVDDGSQKWVIAAQAFHWADPPVALPEIARVLAPGGAFTAVWNDRDFEAGGHMTFARQTYEREVPEFDEAYRNRDWTEVLKTGAHFAEVRYREVSHVVEMSAERYLDLWRGHNRLNNIAGPERFTRFITAVEGYLRDHALASVPVTYRCRAWTAFPG